MDVQDKFGGFIMTTYSPPLHIVHSIAKPAGHHGGYRGYSGLTEVLWVTKEGPV